MVQHSDAEAAIIRLPHGGNPTVFAGDGLDGAIEKADISVFRTGGLDAGETEFGQIIPTGGRHRGLILPKFWHPFNPSSPLVGFPPMIA
jgi:hypothetical protein